MKAVILAGGLGTRISEETTLKPKPMVEIGGKPIIWHIMKMYSHFGINDFIICLGYKGYIIKEFFANYALHMSDVTISLASNKVIEHNNKSEPWNVTLVDTGEFSQTGGRLKRIKNFVQNETFCMTYGDGVSDVNIAELISFHHQNRNQATLTAIQQPGRFGSLEISNNQITSFKEKPLGDGAWINGGFFVLEPEVLDLITEDNTIWEKQPLEKLSEIKQLGAYKHTGFWQCMDTVRDKNYLEELWINSNAPWKKWQ